MIRANVTKFGQNFIAPKFFLNGTAMSLKYGAKPSGFNDFRTTEQLILNLISSSHTYKSNQVINLISVFNKLLVMSYQSPHEQPQTGKVVVRKLGTPLFHEMP